MTATHAWQRETDHCNGAEEVDLELGSIVFLALFLNGADKIDTSIVNEDIDPAEVFLGSFDRSDPLLCVCHIHLDSERCVRILLGKGVHVVYRSGSQNNPFA